MTRKFLLPALFYGLLTACSFANTNKDWTNARTENTVAAYESYIDKHPGDEHAAWARKRIGTLLDDSAWQTAQLSAVVAMDNGSISRRIIELASTDARAIFRKAAGMSPISCLVGVLDIRGGIGTLSPLRIRSADGTITGRGSFDIYRHQIDITVASEARTSSLFALNVPVRVNGSFASPTIRPASTLGRRSCSALGRRRRKPTVPHLPPFARRSACLSARAG